jgi:hypothetical protein
MSSTQEGARRSLNEVEERLRPERVRARAIRELDGLFRGGRTPDPPPDGLLSGRPISATVSAGFDSLARRMADVYMPWQGKSFVPRAGEGVNLLAKSALKPMKVLWPGYEPVRVMAERVEAFPFKTRVAPGSADPDLEVLTLDYDFEANPSFIIRRVVDELVQIGAGLYLGKILYRYKGGFRPIGFFVLEK